MSSAYLSSYIDNASFYLERFIPRARAHSLNWRQMQDMSTSYRQRAVCSVLLTGLPDQFHINMMQSAGAFLLFLEHFPNEQKITSQAKPFFDALCGGYLDAARAIAKLSRDTWHEGYEYQEDFLYAWFLMQLVLGQQSTKDLELLVDRLDVTQAGAEPEKVAMSRALLARDSSSFNATLAAMLTKRRDTIEVMIERGSLKEEFWSWLRYFSGEGLALVRIAEHLGIATEQNYLHIPELLRTPAAWTFDPHAWHVIDYSA